MNKGYKKLDTVDKCICTLICIASMLWLIALAHLTVYAFNTNNDQTNNILLAEPIIYNNDAKVQTLKDIPNMTGGVEALLEEYKDYTLENNICNQEYKSNFIDGFDEPQYIRCTGYCDYGYTKSGEYVREGIVAGKKEWLGKTCYIYQVADDGSCGELIGIYEFLDTGYGINGSLINGTSIDVWFPSENAVWDWMKTYGDYVYIQILDAVG